MARRGFGITTNKYTSYTKILVCLALLTLCHLTSGKGEEIIYESDLTSHSNADGLVRVRRQSSPSQDGVTTTPKPSVVNEDATNYYTVQYYGDSVRGGNYWRELSEDDDGVVRHKSLQDAYRLAVKIDLPFTFLFYGHTVDTVTIATGGFLYMSDFLHSFLTASQYIAPLMANFDTSIGQNESEILYKEEDDAFIVQWTDVFLKGKKDLGTFTFQVQLYKEDGMIVAAYKDIPYPITNLTSAQHPVKVGLSDAYYWDIGQYRTIYPYHTLNASWSKISSNSAIVFTHKKTCNMLTSCDECLTSQLDNFRCYWCSAINKCSDAFDRQRQQWVTTGCVSNITQTHCDHMFTTLKPVYNRKVYAPVARATVTKDSESWKAVTAALCTVFALTAAVILGFVVYGYRNPHGTIGQWMVRNRPSELWSKFKSWKDKDTEAGNMTQIG